MKFAGVIDTERIVRVHGGDDETVIMVDSFDEPLHKVLVLLRDDDRLQIIRATGDLERVLDQVLESDLIRTGQRLGGGVTGGGSGAGSPDGSPVRSGGGTGG